MQQLSLLPSSGVQQPDSQGASGVKRNDASPRFKQAYGEAESALKSDQEHNASAIESRGSDSANQTNTALGAENGNNLPENSEGLPADNGRTLPPHSAAHSGERPARSATGEVAAEAAKGEGLGLPGAVAVASGGKGVFSADPLASAISALAASNAPLVENAQGKGVGVGILADGSSLEPLPTAGTRAGLSSSAQISSETNLRAMPFELAAEKLHGKTVAADVAQSQVKPNFQFEINGASQMSASAEAKLAELTAKAAATADAGGNGVSGAPGTSEKPAAGVAQASMLQGSVLGTALKESVGFSPQPAANVNQAANVNSAALSGVNPNAQASANEQAQFNKLPGGELASQVAANAADPVNGMQAESELRFKAAMESVQSARISDAADSVDVNAIKLDTTTPTAKGSEMKSAEAQAQNVARPYVSSLGIPVDDAEWPNQLGQKLMWMNARNIQTAELHLNPADLGPIDVRIQVGSDQSSISFNTQNQGVRELLEANIHRLREMLNNPTQADSDQSGGTLAQDSGSQSQGESQAQSNGESLLTQSGSAVLTGSDEGERRDSQLSPAEDRLIDAYV